MQMFQANTDKAAAIRAGLKDRGIKANVRCCRWSYRIVLPAHTSEAVAEVRNFLVLSGLKLVGGASPTNGIDYARAWSVFQGRGQLFVYDVR